MTDDELSRQIDEMLEDEFLSLLYRLECLEERSGLVDRSGIPARLPSVSSSEDRDLVMTSIRNRVEALEKMFGQ